MTTRLLYFSVIALGTLTLAALVTPLLYAVWLSFTPLELLEAPKGEWSLRWYRAFFADSRWTDGLWNSLLIGALAAGLSVISGGGVAVAVVEYRFRGSQILSIVTLLPLFLPSLLLGLALLPTMRILGLWGTPFALAAAHSLWGMPLVKAPCAKNFMASTIHATPEIIRGKNIGRLLALDQRYRGLSGDLNCGGGRTGTASTDQIPFAVIAPRNIGMTFDAAGDEMRDAYEGNHLFL